MLTLTLKYEFTYLIMNIIWLAIAVGHIRYFLQLHLTFGIL